MFDALLQSFQSSAAAAGAAETLLNLAMGVVLSCVLSVHYVRYGRTYSNRHELAQVLACEAAPGRASASCQAAFRSST